MKAVVLSIVAAVSLAGVSGLPWPKGFKYPSSYVSKWTDMVQSGANTFRPDFTSQQVIYFDAVNQRKAGFYETKLGRSTYDEPAIGRTVTIDWDKSQCWDDG